LQDVCLPFGRARQFGVLPELRWSAITGNPSWKGVVLTNLAPMAWCRSPNT